MILCHKCSGLLQYQDENTTGLYGCGCISGYVRGFEKNSSRWEAIRSQVAATARRIDLFVGQERSDDEIAPYHDRLARLEALLNDPSA